MRQHVWALVGMQLCVVCTSYDPGQWFTYEHAQAKYISTQTHLWKQLDRSGWVRPACVGLDALASLSTLSSQPRTKGLFAGALPAQLLLCCCCTLAASAGRKLPALETSTACTYAVALLPAGIMLLG